MRCSGRWPGLPFQPSLRKQPGPELEDTPPTLGRSHRGVSGLRNSEQKLTSKWSPHTFSCESPNASRRLVKSSYLQCACRRPKSYVLGLRPSEHYTLKIKELAMHTGWKA